MRKFNFHTFLLLSSFLIFSLLIFSPCALGMKRQEQKQKDTPSKSTGKKVISKLPQKEKVTLSDVPTEVFGDVLFPFVKEKKELLEFRRTNKSIKEGVKSHSEWVRPFKLQEINPDNIGAFLKLLNTQPKTLKKDLKKEKGPKGIDFFVAITLVGKISKDKLFSARQTIKEISNKDFQEMFNLIGKHIKELNLINFDFEEINLIVIKQCPIRKLTLQNCINLKNKFIGYHPEAPKENPPFAKSNLPATLQELDFSTCEDEITGSTFDSLPNRLKIIKLNSLRNIPLIYVDDIPKTVTEIYIFDTEEDMLTNPDNQEKIKKLNDKGIKTFDLNKIKYPADQKEVKEYKEEIHKKATAEIEKMSENY